MINYYQILNIQNNASTKEIKKKYYLLALKYHPDKNNGNLKACEKFKLLSEAYTILSNPKKRFLYDIHFTFGLHPTTIHFSDNELDLIHKYYRQIIDSTEFKLLKLLYYSLPKHIKKKIYHKIYRKNTDLIDISNIKYIDISNLYNDFIICLKRKLIDVYVNSFKYIIVMNKKYNICFHIFITHSDYIIQIKNNSSNVWIKIETDNNTNYIIDQYDLYLNYKINLYEYYFQNTYDIRLPNDNIITINKNIMHINHKGLHNPLTNKRGNIYISFNLNLSISNIEQYRDIIKEIFN